MWSWSSLRRSNETGGSAGTSSSAGRNQVASESALTAIGTVAVRAGPPRPSSARVSDSSRVSCRANRTSTSPDSVSRTGFDRSTSTRPIRCSSAFTRWLTAGGVTCRTAAARSNDCSSTTASRVRTWSSGRSDITNAYLSSESLPGIMRTPASTVGGVIAALSAGFGTGMSLVVAIGAQNAFVLRQGLRGGLVVPVILVRTLSDAVLIAAGVSGIGAVPQRWPPASKAIAIVGGLFLVGYGILAARRAFRPGALTVSPADLSSRSPGSTRTSISTPSSSSAPSRPDTATAAGCSASARWSRARSRSARSGSARGGCPACSRGPRPGGSWTA